MRSLRINASNFGPVIDDGVDVPQPGLAQRRLGFIRPRTKLG
jgi:hypothetical protein